MRKREPLAAIEVEGDTWECAHKDKWPPIEVIAYQVDLIDPLPPDVPIAEAFRGVLPDVVYQRIRTWEQVCGLRAMCPQKCPSCRFSVKNGVPTSVVGTGLTHTIHTPHPTKKRQ